MTTQEKVISMVSWVADVPATRVCPTTNIKEDLNLDSIDVMMLIVKLEKWFDVILSSEEVEAIETVKDASDCINTRMKLAA
ncbi:MAG: acyl carrier protein [Polaribacter sp.]|jgi:acyl carrier protein